MGTHLESGFRSNRPHSWYNYFAATAIMTVAMLAALTIDQLLPRTNVLPVLLVGVLIAAVRTSFGASLWSSLLGLLIYNYFFTEPYHTFVIAHRDDLVTVAFFVLLSSVTGNLATRLRLQMLALRESKARIEDLLGLSRDIAGAAGELDIMQAAARFLHPRMNAMIYCLQSNEAGHLHQALTYPQQAPPLDEQTLRRANAVSTASKLDASTQQEAVPGLQLYRLASAEGEILAVIVFRQDVTSHDLTWSEAQIRGYCQLISQALERARLSSRLETARLDAETERLRSALLSSVSHDLKTPLATMIGSTSSLLQYHDRLTPEDRQALLEGTLQEAERLHRYIDNLLDMTRLGYGTLKLERDWVTLNDIVGSATHRLQSVLSKFELIVTMADDIPLLFVHAALIEQAIVNILENAARFAPEGSTLTIEASIQEQTLSLDITDEGPGIPEAERKLVFNTFYSAAKGDRQKGTGLGLAICHGMIGAHGGRVEALDGRHGIGTTFRISLPLHNQPLLPDDSDE
ncbi:sensor histidine kinase [Allohahella marinimesophila]|uniref:histidine kinase n=1 Tax=Allohahella marinimesophila TaxID=1054972 RepID=A0ABP7P1R9_9GAMM